MREKSQVLIIFVFVLVALMSVSVIHADGHCEFADETIILGGLAPLSPPGSTAAGVVIDWAFGQAAADINAECGVEIDGVNHRLEVKTGDSEGTSERGQAVVERLILEDGVHGVVGMYHSAVGLATMGILQEHRIPTIVAGPWNDNITANGIQEFEGTPPRIEDGVDYIFRISPSTSMVNAVASNWLISLGVEDVILIVENTDYGQPAAADMRGRLEAEGISIEQFDVELGTEDFVPILSRILARPQVPDAIRLVVTGETSLNLNQQMAELGIAPNEDTICIAGYLALQSEQFWANTPDGNYCAFERVGIIPSLFNDIGAALNAKHEEAFGDVAPSFAMEPYDAVHLMADAMERAGTYTDPDAIAAAIEVSDVEFSQGHYYFAYGSHNPELPEGTPAYMWHQWPNPIVTVMQYFDPGQSSLDAAVIYPETYQTHGTSYIMPGTSP